MDEISLQNIEYLLCQSLNGLHLLWDHSNIAQILRVPTEDIDFFTPPNIERLEDLFHNLINKKSFHEKQLYLQSLDQESYEMLLRAYFHILDNTAMIATEYRH
ncbi:MAG: hypothetical protein R2827_12500 [Bdellovibrionales bacterium]